jgi:hypothetical protein
MHAASSRDVSKKLAWAVMSPRGTKVRIDNEGKWPAQELRRRSVKMMSSEIRRAPSHDLQWHASDYSPRLRACGAEELFTTAAIDDADIQWAIDAYETVASRMFPGIAHQASARFIEQLATASRALVLVPRSRPEYARSIEFHRLASVPIIAQFRRLSWRERDRRVEMRRDRADARSVQLQVDLIGEDVCARPSDSAQTPLQCTSAVSLGWRCGASKPRTMYCVVLYDDFVRVVER